MFQHKQHGGNSDVLFTKTRYRIRNTFEQQHSPLSPQDHHKIMKFFKTSTHIAQKIAVQSWKMNFRVISGSKCINVDVSVICDTGTLQMYQ